MIGEVSARVGSPIALIGRAYDLGHVIQGVQFSLDEGHSWTTYPVRGANDYQPVDWSLSFTPPRRGLYRFWIRSVNDIGATSPEAAYVAVHAL